MYDVQVWIYEYAPNWSSSTWEYVVLGIALFSVVFRFVAMRTKNKRDDQLTAVVDLAEAQARNLRNRARKRELDAAKLEGGGGDGT